MIETYLTLTVVCGSSMMMKPVKKKEKKKDWEAKIVWDPLVAYYCLTLFINNFCKKRHPPPKYFTLAQSSVKSQRGWSIGKTGSLTLCSVSKSFIPRKWC